MNEQWREVPEFPGYFVSDVGRVRSNRRGVVRDLKAYPNTHDYPSVTINAKPRAIHRLVASAFLGPCPAGMEVAHWDGDRSNARLSNLRYATRVENRADSIRHGTQPRGEGHGFAKLTDADVTEIRRAVAEGRTYRFCADHWGTCVGNIHHIVHRRTWAHVP